MNLCNDVKKGQWDYASAGMKVSLALVKYKLDPQGEA